MFDVNKQACIQCVKWVSATQQDSGSKMDYKRRGILFDLDNTLLPSWECHQNAMKSVMLYLQKQYELDSDIAQTAVETYRKYASLNPVDPDNEMGFRAWREHLWSKSLAHHGIVNVDSKTLYDYAERTFLEGMVFSKETISVLTKLREDYKLAIITNGDSYFQQAKVKHSMAFKFVDDVIISSEHNLQKPDAKLFHIACRKIGLENRQCIIVGDNMSTDIMGGLNSGLKATVLITNSGQEPSVDQSYVKPDFCISRLYDLLNLVEKIHW